MKNEKYIKPELKVTMFYDEDVITTSTGEDIDDNGGIDLPDDEW